MADENDEKNPGEGNDDYIRVIQELKENTVSKEIYEKLKADNKKLLDTLVAGGSMEEQEEQKETVEELRKKLFEGDGNLSNLEYISAVVDLRDALIEAGKPDPFLPFGHNTVPTREEVEQAERVASVFKECIEYAEGDSSIFTNELQRRTIDVRIGK